MARSGWFVAALCTAFPAAGAGQTEAPLGSAPGRLPGVTARAPLRLEGAPLSPPLAERTCAIGAAPAPLSDPSAGLYFAKQPGAQHDAQTLSLATLRPLLDVRLATGTLQLFILGSPLRPGLRFSLAGWRPRWPFC